MKTPIQIADTNTYSAANFHCRLTATTEIDEKPTTSNRIQMKRCLIFRFASIRIAKQMMLLAGESHAIVFCQLIRAIGKFLIGVSIRTVAADTRFVRRVLGRIVDKANEFVLDCDKGVLDHRIGFGEIGHKLVLEINISDVIGRLGPLHIKAAPGKLFKEQPVKIGFISQSVSSFPDNLFASLHL